MIYIPPQYLKPFVRVGRIERLTRPQGWEGDLDVDGGANQIIYQLRGECFCSPPSASRLVMHQGVTFCCLFSVVLVLGFLLFVQDF